jgi:hypothetical protein
MKLIDALATQPDLIKREHWPTWADVNDGKIFLSGIAYVLDTDDILADNWIVDHKKEVVQTTTNTNQEVLTNLRNVSIILQNELSELQDKVNHLVISLEDLLAKQKLQKDDLDKILEALLKTPVWVSPSSGQITINTPNHYPLSPFIVTSNSDTLATSGYIDTLREAP